jgi:hypothetical protein
MATNGHRRGYRDVPVPQVTEPRVTEPRVTEPRVTEPVVSLRLIDGTRVDRPLRQLTASQVAGAMPWRQARNVAGQTHYPGYYWSATTGAHVIYESRLELARLLLADFDPQAATPRSGRPERGQPPGKLKIPRWPSTRKTAGRARSIGHVYPFPTRAVVGNRFG